MNSNIGLTHQTTAAGLALIAAATAVFTPTAFAQSGDSARQALEEIIVTARKRDESIMDIPVSISAFSELEIANARIDNLQDVARLSPSLVVAESVGRQTSSPSIRGVAPLSFADPTVLVYVDGFTLGFTRTQNNAMLAGLERIEVLRGPQATLYGRNALGGVINYITKKPTERVEGHVDIELGDYEWTRLNASVSGPISEANKLYGSVSVGYSKYEGFMYNRWDDQENVNGEEDRLATVNLRYSPTDRTTLNFTYTYGKADDDCGDCSHVPDTFLGSLVPDAYLELGAGNVDFNDVDRSVNQDFLGWFKRDEDTFVLNAEVEFDKLTWTSIVGYGDSFTSIAADQTREPGVTIPIFGAFFVVDRDNDGWSAETRLASNTDGAFSWLVGLYAYEYERRAQIYLEDPTTPNFGDTTLFTNNTLNVENYAAFVNFDYDLSEAWNIGVGLRYDYEDNGSLNELNGETRSVDKGVFLPRVDVTYRVSDYMNLFGTISRGYHAGGTNNPVAPEPTYEPEFLTNYEAGIKGSTADGRLSYELAAFYMDWEDQQVQQFIIGPNITYILNEGESDITGLEATFSAVPLNGFTLAGSFSWLDAEYAKYNDNLNAPILGLDPDLSGNQVIFAPDVTASLSGQYIFPITGNWDARLRANVSYVGERAMDPTNLAVLDPYSVTSLYAGMQNGRYEIGAFVDNLFDETYVLGGSISTSFFAPLTTIGDPRIWGVRGRINFGD